MAQLGVFRHKSAHIETSVARIAHFDVVRNRRPRMEISESKAAHWDVRSYT